ncbi:MAG TPA: ribosome biogenesis factor YjgA [Limnobacter sp.]|uniref:ribosome biogenesis factor YjgA n=1 Tax=Limnobacter sp. TaxID=2003368 RepID=UPI002ED8B187
MKHQNDHDHAFNDDDPPSKSAVKREMLALQDLGKTLCELPFEKVKKAPIGERLLEAIAEFHKCRSFGAKKRQLQFIGKLMRQEEHDDIQAWVNGESVEQKLKVLNLHAAEQWRDRLIQEPALLADLIKAYPQAAQLNLNTMIRQAASERTNNKPPKNYRQLFQAIYKMIAEASGGDASQEGDLEDDEE